MKQGREHGARDTGGGGGVVGGDEGTVESDEAQAKVDQ